MSDLNKLTIADARDMLRAKKVSAKELTADCLTAIDAADALGAYVHKTPELAMDQAAAADARLAAGDAPDMCGIPLGIKDLFCTKGVESQSASRILQGFKPEYESTVSQKLLDAGAPVVPDHHHVGDPEPLDCELNCRQRVQVAVHDDVGDIAMHEHFTGLQPSDLVGWDAAIGTPDPHVTGLLLLTQASEKTWLLRLHLLGPAPVVFKKVVKGFAQWVAFSDKCRSSGGFEASA